MIALCSQPHAPGLEAIIGLLVLLGGFAGFVGWAVISRV
jgi:hypothetical protein